MPVPVAPSAKDQLIANIRAAISTYDDAVDSEPSEVTCTPFRDTADRVADAAQALITFLETN